MFAGIVIRQGERLVRYKNALKQYEEENKGLRDEIDFMHLDKDHLIGKIKNIINVGNLKKEPYVVMIEKIQKELANAENID